MWPFTKRTDMSAAAARALGEEAIAEVLNVRDIAPAPEPDTLNHHRRISAGIRAQLKADYDKLSDKMALREAEFNEAQRLDRIKLDELNTVIAYYETGADILDAPDSLVPAPHHNWGTINMFQTNEIAQVEAMREPMADMVPPRILETPPPGSMPQPIPDGVYWSVRRKSFFSRDTGEPMGVAFDHDWTPRADEFPRRMPVSKTPTE